MILAPKTKMKSDTYFFSMSLILYAIMLVGFAHSFLFRASVLHRGPLPPIFIIHSVLNIAWFSALVSQSWLAMSNKIINHKRNGIYWFALSILVVAFNCVIIYKTAHKPPEADVLGPVFGNSVGVVSFICYVSGAYFFRHQPDIHKRLLLFTYISMLGTAIDRFQRYEILRFASPEMNLLVYNILIQQVLYFSVLAYDIVMRKRPHIVTIVLLLINFVVMYLFYLALVTGGAVKYLEFLRSH
jgi:hypothetical protein